MARMRGEKPRNWALIVALMVTAVLFLGACGFVYYFFGVGKITVELLAEIPEEARDFVALVREREAQGSGAESGISSFYFENAGTDVFYLWFDAGYAPDNLRVLEWIDVDIRWDRGEPVGEPQLYRIQVERGLLKNAVWVTFYEEEQRIKVADYTYQLLGDDWTSYQYPD